MRRDGLLHTADITEGKVSAEEENYQTAKEVGKIPCHDGSVMHLTSVTYYIFVKMKNHFWRPLNSFHLPFHNETHPLENTIFCYSHCEIWCALVGILEVIFFTQVLRFLEVWKNHSTIFRNM